MHNHVQVNAAEPIPCIETRLEDENTCTLTWYNLYTLCALYVLVKGMDRVCNRLSGYSDYLDIRKNLSVRIAI